MSIGIILGTGWNRITDDLKIIKRDSYQELFKLQSTVPGHGGELIRAKLGDIPLTVMSGRLHLYEGYTPEQVTQPIEYLKKLGIEKLIITNAVGGLNPKYKVGDFVVLNDMLTLLAPSPLKGPKFLDLSSAFDPKLRLLAISQAKRLKLRVFSGVYGYAHGPHFETPADKKALLLLGADVVGMSHVPETVMANYLGIKVLGLTFVTNLAFVKHSHQEVLAQSHQAAPSMSKLLKAIIEKI